MMAQATKKKIVKDLNVEVKHLEDTVKGFNHLCEVKDLDEKMKSLNNIFDYNAKTKYLEQKVEELRKSNKMFEKLLTENALKVESLAKIDREISKC